ncbi:MAG TPA: glycosyltransferase family 39 protein [Candidatus Acidoferrum sp.]|nr:glycosyltransferase family 39 protein [Candidatus Acidoferrum sp.]
MVVPTPSPGRARLNRIRHWLARHPYGTLAVVVVALLAPFLSKPFNIDDPLFIWAARQIHAHPLDPYGFKVEWGWTQFPMWKVTENPPLACYYLALAAAGLGWSEAALHFAFLLPALAVAWGTYRLACRLCRQPLLAALAAVFTPVFLVSGTTVMCDMLMLAFWVWAMEFWLEGAETGNARRLWGAAGLMTLGALTKYYGACLIPLLAVYSAANRQRFKSWGACLLLPLAALWAYQCATEARYGTSLLYGAADYAQFSKGFFGFSPLTTSLTALAFMGGGLAVVLFSMPWLWRPRQLSILAGLAVLITTVVFLDQSLLQKYHSLPAARALAVKFQMSFWAVGGVGLLALAVADLLRRRDAPALLLALWVAGTFTFAGFVNWTINARSILPLAPAVGILLARRRDQIELAGGRIRAGVPAGCLAASVALSVLVARADFLLAHAVRQCAREIRVDMEPGGTMFFQGHWGFQYYLQGAGVSPFDVKLSALKPGSRLIIPSNNTNVLPLKPEKAGLQQTFTAAGPRLLTTWSQPVGAGFYSSAWGPLPFAFGEVPDESVSVFVLK